MECMRRIKKGMRYKRYRIKPIQKGINTMKTLDEKVIALAEQMSKAFERRERKDGKEYVCLKDEFEKTVWMKDVLRSAHGDLFPNDYIYKFVEN